MNNHISESQYNLHFRREEAQRLGKYLQERRSVNLIGMRRVGISNFLRFFLYHKDIAEEYSNHDQKQLFISVDLNDLVEREIYPFWTLTLKRIVDACEVSDLPQKKTKDRINTLFLAGIQSQDLFLVIDTIRKILHIIVQENMAPTLFFLRFDRLQSAFNISFFDNLEGLYDATHENLAYVFTSYRSLDSIFPTTKTTLSVFAQQMYIQPATEKDMEIVYASYQERYHLSLPKGIEQALFRLVAGNIQYLHLALIILDEKKGEQIATEEELLNMLVADERITLESEELWESLTKEEKRVLVQIAKGQIVTNEDKAKAVYLWDTGFVINETVFSSLLKYYLLQKDQEDDKKEEIIHLTRKEHLFFSVLEGQKGEICEREKIIETVWPEYKDFGVSDWAIDRLVARVRVKLRKQKSDSEIVTVRTRGYKLSSIKE